MRRFLRQHWTTKRIKTEKKVFRKPKNIKSKDQEITHENLVLNPPHGKKGNFEKITATLPSPIRQLLLDETQRRKVERDPNWSISVIVREALIEYLGSQQSELHHKTTGKGTR